MFAMGMHGKKHSEATKEKIRQAHLGRKMSEQARLNMSKGQKRRAPPSKETLLKRSIALKGKKRPPFSKQWKAKISESLRGKTGNKARNWQGGRLIKWGYVHIYMPDHPNASGKYYAEHRYVVEQSIGRYLGIDEVIHHINGDKLDNRIENLLITNKVEHKKIHHADIGKTTRIKKGQHLSPNTEFKKTVKV